VKHVRWGQPIGDPEAIPKTWLANGNALRRCHYAVFRIDVLGGFESCRVSYVWGRKGSTWVKALQGTPVDAGSIPAASTSCHQVPIKYRNPLI